MSKKPRFRILLDRQHAKGSQTLPESTRQHFYLIFPSLWRKLSWKVSPLIIYGIFGLFVNTSTAEGKHVFCNSAKLEEPVQMQLSKKQYTFPNLFAPILKSTSIFKHFSKKDDPHSLYIFEITDCKRLRFNYTNV